MITPHAYDMSVFVLQGGGALGAYQVGILEGLLNHGCTPDWMIGTSIGAINSAIIAGNLPENRIAKLKEFWQTIATPTFSFFPSSPSLPFNQNVQLRRWENFLSGQWTVAFGQSGFFAPCFVNPLQLFYNDPPDKLGFYNTQELAQTLERVVDFKILNQKRVRLTLLAVNLEDGEITQFDNTKQNIEPKHIMASGALPPGFPAIEIEGKYYWDGGVSSNTPFEIVLNEKLPQKIMCFMVNLFPNFEQMPTNLLDVFKRQKDIQYASRYHQVLHSLCEAHRMQYAIHKVYSKYKDENPSDELTALCEFGHPSSLNMVRFQYKDKPYDLFSKDFDFSSQTLVDHYLSGVLDVENALREPTWLDIIDDEAGLVLHEF